eukprot:TRINITY_DN368_c0_g1_i2.p1 TRINITY_DN368_c0_g1~~TRINITY_DN368_c0_g1_i2.p1  ORF type:complete len:132 (-),score=41.24 TRINITY_DN368_c0_g1_i2:221-616(-)
MDNNTKRIAIFALGVLQLVGFIVGAAGVGSLPSDEDPRVVWWGLVLSLITALGSCVLVAFLDNPILTKFVSSLVLVAAGGMTIAADGFRTEDSSHRTATAGCVLSCLAQYGLLIVYATVARDQFNQVHGFA